MTLRYEYRFIVRTVIAELEQTSNAAHHTYVNQQVVGRDEKNGGAECNTTELSQRGT